jgi:hypothetical protein
VRHLHQRHHVHIVLYDTTGHQPEHDIFSLSIHLQQLVLCGLSLWLLWLNINLGLPELQHQLSDLQRQR